MTGDIIREKRIARGWSQQDLAEKMGYKDRSAITRIEKGHNDVSTPKLKKFAEVFGCTPAELVDYTVRDCDTEILVERIQKLSEDDIKRVMKFVEILEATK